ncbi:MAG: hypothetical protein IT294_14135 [Deltaproteobacteria bacterium]|nr:hypothetical protein [Deltaproteobacteria bacterium]
MTPRARTIVVPHADLIGRTAVLAVTRLGAAGAVLAEPDWGSSDDPAAGGAPLVLPKREMPAGTRVGDALSVFVTLDSEDRPIATTRLPALQLGEVAFLRVTAVTPVGAFADWGLPKELLIPFREQTRDLRVGERHPVGLFVDKTGRLAGTMRVSEMLRAKPVVRPGEWVAGVAWRADPAVGLFVIVERRFVGLVPKSEPHGLERGASAMFRVARLRPDGRFELSLRAPAHEEIGDDAAHVLAILRAGAGGGSVGDASSPEEIRGRFGLSKKAFKRAVGRLLKEGAVVLGRDGALRVPSTPGALERSGAPAAAPAASPAGRPRRPRGRRRRTRPRRRSYRAGSRTRRGRPRSRRASAERAARRVRSRPPPPCRRRRRSRWWRRGRARPVGSMRRRAPRRARPVSRAWQASASPSRRGGARARAARAA